MAGSARQALQACSALPVADHCEAQRGPRGRVPRPQRVEERVHPLDRRTSRPRSTTRISSSAAASSSPNAVPRSSGPSRAVRLRDRGREVPRAKRSLGPRLPGRPVRRPRSRWLTPIRRIRDPCKGPLHRADRTSVSRPKSGGGERVRGWCAQTTGRRPSATRASDATQGPGFRCMGVHDGRSIAAHDPYK